MTTNHHSHHHLGNQGSETPRSKLVRGFCFAAALSVAAILVACGGGGGDSGTTTTTTTPSTTPSTFSGPISGFGSIFVNGVRIDDSKATITLDDDNPNAGHDDLRLGMVVDVQGQRDASGTTGSATAIASRSFVQGPVSAINLAGNSFTVFGVTVNVFPSTVFDGNSLSALAGLSVNDVVEVHGLADSTGTTIKATRIERKNAGAEARLIGTAQNVTSTTFTVNNVTVTYSASVLDKITTLTNGTVVRIKGTIMSPTAILSTRVRPATLQPQVINGQEAEVEGTVTAVRSSNDFDVAGIRVQVANGATVDGTPVVGGRVEVKGTVSNGVLMASRVHIEDEAHEANEANEFHANITGTIDRTAQTFTLNNGVTVKWTSSTVFDKASLPNGASDLTAGMRLEVRGQVQGNVVVASRIKRDN
uniref:DUF5666 domain-containing protein n=1 Tax=Cupriavidus yeoncheonensis TaxID=1462994 RepID=UPI003F498B1B